MLKQPKKRAFTLVEILVAMGIIVILVSIMVPFISRSMRQSKTFRTKADFQAIAQAIEAYKQDFGDIPRLPTDSNGVAIPNLGAAVLGKALLGLYGDATLSIGAFETSKTYFPGDVVRDSSSLLWLAYRPPVNAAPSAPLPNTVVNWLEVGAFPVDLFNGPGFRVRQGGKSYGPYLLPEKIKHHGLFLMDSDDNPILYSPAKPGRSDVTKQPSAGVPGPYVDQAVAGQPGPLFNANDNFEMFRRADETGGTSTAIILARIQMMMGDARSNGYIQSSDNETAITQPYVLWSSGPDGMFGPADYKPAASGPTVDAAQGEANRKAVSACDDITNFN